MKETIIVDIVAILIGCIISYVIERKFSMNIMVENEMRALLYKIVSRDKVDYILSHYVDSETQLVHLIREAEKKI